MPRVKCSWDCCKHIDEDGYCNNPEDVVLESSEIIEVGGDGKETGETMEILECNSFVDYRESESEAEHHGTEGS